MDIVELIDEQMAWYQSKNMLAQIPDDFIYITGPFMCMYKDKGYEKICDEIAKHNPIMRAMVYSAYIIRKITSGISYGDSKKLLKKFIINVDQSFSKEESDIKAKLTSFGINYIDIIRKEQSTNKNLESFVTCASPIVSYEDQLIDKESDDFFRVDNSKKFQKDLTLFGNTLESRNLYLKKIFLNNIGEIMMHYELANATDIFTLGSLNIRVVEEFIANANIAPIKTLKYYFFAIINYAKISSEKLNKTLNFFRVAGDFSKDISFESFTNMINNLSKDIDIKEIAIESLSDPEMDKQESEAIGMLLKEANDKSSDSNNRENAKYDLGALNDYINIRRYMEFNDYANRLFTASLTQANIININSMGNGKMYYEMSNDTIACPFVDLRDFMVKVIVLYSNDKSDITSNNIIILDDITDMY